jgi:hypothetical protein
VSTLTKITDKVVVMNALISIFPDRKRDDDMFQTEQFIVQNTGTNQICKGQPIKTFDSKVQAA